MTRGETTMHRLAQGAGILFGVAGVLALVVAIWPASVLVRNIALACFGATMVGVGLWVFALPALARLRRGNQFALPPDLGRQYITRQATDEDVEWIAGLEQRSFAGHAVPLETL